MLRYFLRKDEFHICLVLGGSTLGLFLSELVRGKVFSSMYALGFWLMVVFGVGFLIHRLMEDLRSQYRKHMRAKRRNRLLVRSLEVRK